MPLNIDWQQILLHLMNFVILAGGLYLLLYKPVKKFMQKREDKYNEMSKSGEDKLKEGEKFKADYEEKLKKADEEIRLKERESAVKAQEAYDETVKKAEERAAVILKESREKAEEEKKKIISESDREIAALAMDAAQKIISASGKDAYDEFIKAADGKEQGKHE